MGWEDIEDMPATNLREELMSLLRKEDEYASLELQSELDHDEALEATRRNVCQWNYECVDYFLIDREVVYFSMNYYDRFLEEHRLASAAYDEDGRPSDTLTHLLALSSLYVAIKLHGVATDSTPSQSTSSSDPSSSSSRLAGRPRRIRPEDFCNMSQGTYCPRMLEEMEMSLLSQLGWRLHPATPMDYLLRYAKMLSLALSYDDRDGQYVAGDIDSVGKGWSVFEVARYQIELAVYDVELCRKTRPSRLALSAIMNAIDCKFVTTRRTIISPSVRESFVDHLRCLRGEYANLDVEGSDIVEVRRALKGLCSGTIVLPGEILENDDVQPSSSDVSFAPIPSSDEDKTFEYELVDVHEVQTGAYGSSVSPVNVSADLF
jgi:hypothetical protein